MTSRRRNCFKTGPILVASLIASSVAVHAETTATVDGRILDQTGAVLPGVTVTLVVSDSVQTTTSDDQGRYRFEHVRPGKAALTYWLLNFGVLTRTVAVGAIPVTADIRGISGP